MIPNFMWGINVWAWPRLFFQQNMPWIDPKETTWHHLLIFRHTWARAWLSCKAALWPACAALRAEPYFHTQPGSQSMSFSLLTMHVRASPPPPKRGLSLCVRNCCQQEKQKPAGGVPTHTSFSYLKEAGCGRVRGRDSGHLFHGPSCTIWRIAMTQLMKVLIRLLRDNMVKFNSLVWWMLVFGFLWKPGNRINNI